TTVGATIYVTTATLRPMFQARINQQVPVAFSNALAGIVGKLPAQDQGWAQQMATTLIAPSASLTGLSTQAGGLATSLSISLYPGDPKPIAASMLVSFTVKTASTVQVTVKPLNGSPTVVNGPLATFQVPVGQLNGIRTAPNCGDAALAVGLNFPVSLGSKSVSSFQSSGQTTAFNASGNSAMMGSKLSQAKQNMGTSTYPSYVELPSSSLAAIGNSIKSLPISSSQTAQNISVGVSGSDMIINSDIYDSFWGKIGTAQTLVAPTSTNGNLAVHVLSTIVKVFGIFSISYNSYNAQIEQMLNAKLNGALTGKFYVTNAAIGFNAHVPCAASNSLVLTGTANLG
ncbi:MAG: hypothetical protein M3Z24_15045, partial [Chloroflexota bacterium]|nr:hypothetical protein [Chloroflexota bacterium]